MAEKVFVPGFRTFAKRDGAPDFVLGTLIVTLEDFKTFVNGDGRQYLSDYDGKKQLKLNITTNKDGRVNFAVDTWKKPELEEGITPSQETKDRVAAAKENKPTKEEYTQDDNGGLPF